MVCAMASFPVREGWKQSSCDTMQGSIGLSNSAFVNRTLTPLR